MPNRIPKAPHLRGGARKGAGGAGRRVTCMAGDSALAALGSDTLTFLATTVLVVPLFRSVKASPVLGFLLAGAVLNQLGLFRGDGDIEALSELGILFLLFEMGLELSLDRLQALAKYAFVLGTIQVFATTLAFTLFELPVGDALGTQILVQYFGSPPDLVDIRSVTEAIVIGAGLSLSSSAFVLQILSEKGELPTKFGSATLGILLLQDIAVVPLLVILPLLQGSGDMSDPAMLTSLGLTVLKSMAGLAALLVGGRVVLRRVFEVVAGARSPETFVALCLLTVTGTGLITSKLGFSDTLGAFIAGVLLAETNFRTQVEADIRPFRGLLLGLFFVTTGTSIDFPLLIDEWPDVLALLVGLIAVKTAIITAAGPRVGLSLAESVRTGFLLSQGGEFAFVVFALASDLKILPEDLNKLLIIVVVLSMFATPLLADVGEIAAAQITKFQLGEANKAEAAAGEDISRLNEEVNEPVVICGFGKTGQVVASMLSSPLASADGGPTETLPFVVFDLDPVRVQAARKLGYPVVYGDGTSASVLTSAGITRPRAVVVVYVGRQRAVRAVEALSNDYPDVPIFARARDLEHAMQLEEAGATSVVCEKTEFALRLSGTILRSFGVMEEEVLFVKAQMRSSMENRARIVEDNSTGPESPSVTDDMYVYASANLASVTQMQQIKAPEGGERGLEELAAVLGSADDEGYGGGGISGLGGGDELSEVDEEANEERQAEILEAGEERVYSALKKLESKTDTWTDP